MRLRNVVMTVVVLGTTVGCGGGVPEGAGDQSIEVSETRVVSWDGYAAEFRARGKELKMPKGVDFPQDPPMGPEDSGNWQKGVGESDAVLAWNCAWGQFALDPEVDAATKRRALDMFKEIETTPEWQTTFDDHGRELLSDAVAAAQLGDDTEFASIVTAGCSNPEQQP